MRNNSAFKLGDIGVVSAQESEGSEQQAQPPLLLAAADVETHSVGASMGKVQCSPRTALGLDRR